MADFWSCHLIVDRTLFDDCRYVHDFTDADFSLWGRTSTLFLKQTPSNNASIFSLLCSFWENIRLFYR